MKSAFSLVCALFGAVAADDYIVVMNNPDSSGFLSELDFQPKESYTIGSFHAHLFEGLDESMLETVKRSPKVSYVEENGEMHALQASSVTQNNPPSWGLERIWKYDLPLSKQYRYNSLAGRGVDAYIIDTGIYVDHSDFGGRASWGYTASGVDGGDVDCNGHGTHVAGTVGGTQYGVAKEVNLIAVKVLGCQGSGSTAGIIASFEWVAKNRNPSRPAVINLSLGGGRSTALNQALDACAEVGIHNAVAAGNDYYANSCNYSPASADYAYTVGSTTQTDVPSSFSNIGACVNVFAPGSSITAPWINGPTSTATISGTSMASPHVAGVMALLLSQSPSASVDELQQEVTSLAGKDKITFPSSGGSWNSTPNRLLFSDPPASLKRPLAVVE